MAALWKIGDQIGTFSSAIFDDFKTLKVPAWV